MLSQSALGRFEEIPDTHSAGEFIEGNVHLHSASLLETRVNESTEWTGYAEELYAALSSAGRINGFGRSVSYGTHCFQLVSIASLYVILLQMALLNTAIRWSTETATLAVSA